MESAVGVQGLLGDSRSAPGLPNLLRPARVDLRGHGADEGDAPATQRRRGGDGGFGRSMCGEWNGFEQRRRTRDLMFPHK